MDPRYPTEGSNGVPARPKEEEENIEEEEFVGGPNAPRRSSSNTQKPYYRMMDDLDGFTHAAYPELEATTAEPAPKRPKSAESPFGNVSHVAGGPGSFARIQQAHNLDEPSANAPVGSGWRSTSQGSVPEEEDDVDIDVLGSDNEEDGHFVLSTQWMAQKQEAVRKKRRRKSAPFTERREPSIDPIAAATRVPGERRSFVGRPRNDFEDRDRTKAQAQGFGLSHARMHSKKRDAGLGEEEDEYDVTGLDEDGNAMEVDDAKDLYASTNLTVQKNSMDEDEDVDADIAGDMEVSSAPIAPRAPTPQPRPTTAATHKTPIKFKLVVSQKSKATAAAAPSPQPVARRSTRLNAISAVEYEYDVNDTFNRPGDLSHASSSLHADLASSKSAPQTPAAPRAVTKRTQTPKKTSTPKKPKSVPKPAAKSRAFVHNIVTTQQINEFYASLQPTHYQEKASQPKGMVPVLFSYQLRAVSWMTERETSLWRIDNVRGGILADEMGLGKTIEIMGLVISNPRSRFLNPNPRGTGTSLGPGAPTAPSSTPSALSLPSPLSTATASMVPEIVQKDDGWIYPPLDRHDSGATLIVCPDILLQQWKEEMARHSPSLRFHTYKGVPMLTSLEKALDQQGSSLFDAYDVVLCSYETLAKEFPYATKPNVKTRHQHEQPSTPLTKLRWWRICMDEAQMFSQGASNAGKLLRHIEAVNRWAVSGTPIRKDFSDLRGLLLFLGTEHSYFLPTPDALAFLKQISWRHQMDQVSNEIIIPPAQTHTLTMRLTPLEAYGVQRLTQKLKLVSDSATAPTTTTATTDESISKPQDEPVQEGDEQAKKMDVDFSIEKSDSKPPSTVEPTLPPTTTTSGPSSFLADSVSLKTGKYSSCPYQVLLEKYLEQKAVLKHSDRPLLSRSLAAHISSEFYNAQLSVCQAFNAVGDALLVRVRKLKKLGEQMTPEQRANYDSLLAEAASHYQKALDLVLYKKDAPIYAKLVELKTSFFVLSPPSAPFSTVCYHTLVNYVETLMLQGKTAEAAVLDQKAESVRGTALQSQINGVQSARFKFHATKQETSRIIRNRLNCSRGEWWYHALKWIGENVPDFCAKLRKGVTQKFDWQFQSMRTYVLHLNVETVDDVIDKLDLDLTRLLAQRTEAVGLTKTQIPTDGRLLPEFYDTLDKCDDSLYAYQQQLVRDVEMDGFSGAVQNKVLNLAERLLLYIEFIIVDRHNPLMNELRFHPERVSPQEEKTLLQLARWLLMAESTFRELELMKIELHHAQSYNRVKRDYAASLYSLETSALARRPGVSLDDDSILEEPVEMDLAEDELDDSMALATWTNQVKELKTTLNSSMANCINLKHQLEFALEAGREKIPRLDSFGTKLSSVATKILEILKQDANNDDDDVPPTELRNKVLVFSKWSEPLIQLSVFLLENGIQFRFGKDAGVEGRGPHANLAQRLAQFRDDPEVRVLMLNSHSQSTGLTLTQANHVFLLEDLDTAHELQAIGRAHRIGQTRTTHIWKCDILHGEVPSFDEAVAVADL